MHHLFASLLAVALALAAPATPKGYDPPETPDEYRARIGVIMSAISAVTSRPGEQVALFVVARGESDFDWWVHAGLTHPDKRKHQDHGKARCILQIHASRLVPEWQELAGTDLEATKRCMRAGLRLLRSAAAYCHADLETGQGVSRAFALYGSGKTCTPTRKSTERAGYWASYRARIERSASP